MKEEKKEYTIEKKRPPKKENDEKKEKRKDFDYLYAIFGEYENMKNNPMYSIFGDKLLTLTENKI